MSFWYINILAIFLLSALFALIIIPRILLIALRKRLFDMPDERKVHNGVVPRLGGVAFSPIMFLAFTLLVGINLSLSQTELPTALRGEALSLTYASCSVLLLYLVGTADDLIGVRYRQKFLVQLLCGVMLLAGGFGFTDLCGMFELHALPVWVGYPLTLFTVIFVLNAVNLIDGLDGLAAGICILALLVYGVSFIYLGCGIYAMFAFSLLGVLLPYYYYNVFGDPTRGRKIFMGDTGSLTLGMMLCLLGLKLLSVAGTAHDSALPNAFVLAFSPLLVPCMDVVRVYMHRVRHGKSPFLPDKNHIHHKMLACGLGPHHSMISVVTLSMLLTVLNMVLSYWVDITLLLALDAILYTVLNVLLTRRMRTLQKKQAEQEYIDLEKDTIQNEIA
jgi:UDP-N-acetylmuramyl pentapeptide phosphotransferase/UDP-N-acetylglucosamine-1-phosphate transferase